MNQYAINMPNNAPNNALYPLAPHERVYNFSPGPSMLPTEVLAVAQAELLNYRGSGMSVMEISHRSSLFDEIMAHTIADFKTLMQVPDDYHILFTQGGASALNSLVPLNLLGQQTVEGAQAQAAQAAQAKALYAVTGYWSNKTFQEAKRYSEYAEINSVYTAATPYQTIDLCNAQTTSWALPPPIAQTCQNQSSARWQQKRRHSASTGPSPHAWTSTTIAGVPSSVHGPTAAMRLQYSSRRSFTCGPCRRKALPVPKGQREADKKDQMQKKKDSAKPAFAFDEQSKK